MLLIKTNSLRYEKREIHFVILYLNPLYKFAKDKPDKFLFSMVEKIKFNSIWVWAALLYMFCIIMFKVKSRGFYSDTIMASAGLLLLILIVLSIKLVVVYSKQGIQYRLIPFHFKARKILWDEVQSIQFVQFASTLKEYKTFNTLLDRSTGYMINGKKGVLIKVKNRKRKILFASKRLDDVKDLLQKHALMKLFYGEVKVYGIRRIG